MSLCSGWRRSARSAVSALILAIGLATWALPAAAAAAAPVLKDLFGTYLGRATVKDFDSGVSEEREIDVEIAPFRGTGFRIRWVNVTLVDGRRDVAGVKRRVSEVAFVPAKGRDFFVEARDSGVFAEPEEVVPLGGDPVRWAVLDADGLHVYAFFVLADGRYELQSYARKRTAQGVDLRYERVVDGRRLRTIEGKGVRVD